MIEWAKGLIQIEQKHLVGQVLLGRLTGLGERLKRILEKLLMAQVGDELALESQVARGCGDLQDFLFEVGNSIAS